MNYIESYMNGKSSKEELIQKIKDLKDKTDINYNEIGLTKDEFLDFLNEDRNIDFYIFKYKNKKYDIKKIWPGCYVKFAFQYDLKNPHFEYGWVDVVEGKLNLVRIQCDDSYQGNRALTVRIIDIIEILPIKERPLVYYKTMICNDCELCDRESNSFPKNCPKFNFFNSILNKQFKDNDFIKFYQSIKKEE